VPSLARLPAPYPGAHLLAFRRDPLALVRRLAEAGPDGAVAPFGDRALVLVNHPDLIREVLIERHDSLQKSRSLQLARLLLGTGLLTSEDPHHERARRLVLPALHHGRIRQYADVMARRSDQASEAWQDGETLDAHAAMMALTLEIAAETLFGTEIGPEVDRVARATTDALALFERIFNPFARALHYVPLPGTLRFRRARRTLDAVVYGMIAERRRSGEDAGDLLSMLLAAQDEETGAGLTDAEVRDEALTLLLAGHETTANALTFAWWLLADHPEAEARLHAEVDALPEGPVSFGHLEALPYTRQVFAEALRLYPPGWAFSREARHRVEIGGETFRRRDTFVVSPYFLHRDPRWWEAPEAFRPERFPPEAKRDRPKFAYLPFSAGRRGCIGEGFAWTEGVVVLASLARRWRFRPTGAPLDLHPSVTLRPRGPVPLRLERRTT
jgi:cytochrome P450